MSSGGSRPRAGLDEINCVVCTKKFMPYRKKGLTCSKKCKNKIDLKHQKERRYTSQSKENCKNVMADWRRKNPEKNILSRIKTRDPNTNITLDWIKEKLEKGACEITGIEFSFPDYGTEKPGWNYHPWTPSLDRIDNTQKTYRVENCRMVIWAYNRARGAWNDDVVLTMAKGLIKNGLVHS